MTIRPVARLRLPPTPFAPTRAIRVLESGTQVRRVLRDLPKTALTRDGAIAAALATQGHDLLFSRGIPAPEAWGR